MSSIRSFSQSLKFEIKKKIYNKPASPHIGLSPDEPGTERSADSYKDYLYYYQQATRWK